MKPELLLKADLLDILFEHRNKEYGAYTLRKGYNARLFKALCAVPVIFILCLILQYGFNSSSHSIVSRIQSIKDLELKQVEMEQPELPKTPELPKKVATIKDAIPIIVPDNEKADPPPTIDELIEDKAVISTATAPGELPGTATAPAGQPSGTGEEVTTPEPEAEKVLWGAEIMPEFPGGVAGLRRFLSRNLRVPEEVMQPGQQVRIPIRFVVGKDGSLENVDFLVQADESFKKEILRVVNKMPKWKAGSQNGRPVSVYFTIPIIFALSE